MRLHVYTHYREQKIQNNSWSWFFFQSKNHKTHPTGSVEKHTMVLITTQTEHLLGSRSWCKKVSKTLSELHLIFYEVMMVGLVRWGEVNLFKERHCIHKQIDTASKTCGRRSMSKNRNMVDMRGANSSQQTRHDEKKTRRNTFSPCGHDPQSEHSNAGNAARRTH